MADDDVCSSEPQLFRGDARVRENRGILDAYFEPTGPSPLLHGIAERRDLGLIMSKNAALSELFLSRKTQILPLPITQSVTKPAILRECAYDNQG